MTTTKFYICRFAQMFGYSRRNIRMGDAATESYLLKEAEVHLGSMLWREVEDIEELSVEYWNLRKLVKEHAQVTKEFEECQRNLNSTHGKRTELLNLKGDSFEDLLSEKNEILATLESFAIERDLVVTKAHEVKRTYEGIKLKQEILSADGGQGAESIPKRLGELKSKFKALKIQRKDCVERINLGENRLNEIEKKISDTKVGKRQKAAEAFHRITGSNQTLSALRAKIGDKNKQIESLYSGIGRYLSHNFESDPACKKICRGSGGMVDVMTALRKSIRYNYYLGESN